jgi:hypothetical protein
MRRSFVAILFVIAALLIFCTGIFAQSSAREELLKEIEARQLELQKLEKQLLLPAAEDLVVNAEFLTQPDTGVVRLLPREIYDSPVHPEKRLTVRGGGSYYSFTRLTHEYGNGTQIGLEQGQFLTSFAGADYGMLTDVGDVPLEAVNLEHAAVRFLATHERAVNESQARSEYLRFGTGVSNDGASYKTRQPVTVNNSYVFRGIHYSDSDVLVAFRVTRKDSDGSVIIIWKLLKKYPKPELARAVN